MAFLPWRNTPVAQIVLPDGKTVYRDPAPLTDLCSADAVFACLRRRPDRTDILMWPDSNLATEPVVVSGTVSPVLQLVTIAGRSAVISDGNGFLQCSTDGARVLYRSKGRIVRATISPDARKVMWIERQPSWTIHIGEIDGQSLAQVCAPQPSSMAAWLGNEALLFVGEHRSSDQLRLFHLDLRGGTAVSVAATSRFIRILMGSNEDELVAISALGLLPNLRVPVDGGDGCWVLDGAVPAVGRCIAPIPASTFFSVAKRLVVFAAADANADWTHVLAATETSLRMARVAGLIRDAVVTSEGRLLYRGYGDSGAILEQSLEGLW